MHVDLIKYDVLFSVHPNVKLFITHGGISSMHETVDGGVPILGFPLFFDQPRNMGLLVDLGMALTLDILTVKKEVFVRTIEELLTNPSYVLIYFILQIFLL